MALSIKGRRWPLLLSAAGLAAIGGVALAQGGASAPSGEALYTQHCAMCHGANLEGQLGPTLNDVAFKRKWGGKAQALADYIRTSMPPGNAGALTAQEYAAVTRMILAKNGIEGSVASEAGEAAPARAAARPAQEEPGVGGISTRLYPLPPGPKIPDRFANFKPVTEAELDNPAPGDWPAWRRSHRGLGYSPLKQIDTSNVGRLTIAWAQALPPGVNMNEPLVRDGVLYVFGYGDNVFAFDAASGRQLWRYQRKVPQGTGLNSRKTIALYGDKLYTATSDNHMLALDARTGEVVWDVALTDRPGMRIPGGPLAADGVIMQGFANNTAGGGLIVAVDAETGAKLWEFDTVAKPGKLGGDTWNGEPGDQRKGGSVWTSGSYDAVNKLALWGVGNTYDTGPLRDLKPGMNNDALFTETTLAFEPRTGKHLWETRRRQTPDMGVLTTAGGLLFTGWMDRQFVAYDQATGKELWSTGVTGVPNASAITYTVDGKQYVAMVTGVGNPLSFGIPDVIPETQLPSVNSSSVYVFALPDRK